MLARKFAESFNVCGEHMTRYSSLLGEVRDKLKLFHVWWRVIGMHWIITKSVRSQQHTRRPRLWWTSFNSPSYWRQGTPESATVCAVRKRYNYYINLSPGGNTKGWKTRWNLPKFWSVAASVSWNRLSVVTVPADFRMDIDRRRLREKWDIYHVSSTSLILFVSENLMIGKNTR